MPAALALEPMPWHQQHLGPPPPLPRRQQAARSDSLATPLVSQLVPQQGHQALDSAADGSSGVSQAGSEHAQTSAGPWMHAAVAQLGGGAPGLPRAAQSAPPPTNVAAAGPSSSWHMVAQVQQAPATVPRLGHMASSLQLPGLHPNTAPLAATQLLPLPLPELGSAVEAQRPVVSLPADVLEPAAGPACTERGLALAGLLNLPAELVDDDMLELLLTCDL